jgi:hypothetical protein
VVRSVELAVQRVLGKEAIWKLAGLLLIAGTLITSSRRQRPNRPPADALSDPVRVSDEEAELAAHVDTEPDIATEAAVRRVRAEEVLPVPLSCTPDRPAVAGAERGVAVDANGAAARMNASAVDPSHCLPERPAPGAGMRSYGVREHQRCRNNADGSPHDHRLRRALYSRSLAVRKRPMLGAMSSRLRFFDHAQP